MTTRRPRTTTRSTNDAQHTRLSSRTSSHLFSTRIKRDDAPTTHDNARFERHRPCFATCPHHLNSSSHLISPHLTALLLIHPIKFSRITRDDAPTTRDERRPSLTSSHLNSSSPLLSHLISALLNLSNHLRRRADHTRQRARRTTHLHAHSRSFSKRQHFVSKFRTLPGPNLAGGRIVGQLSGTLETMQKTASPSRTYDARTMKFTLRSRNRQRR